MLTLELNRKMAYGFFPELIRDEEKIANLNDLFQEVIMKNNPNGVKLQLDFKHNVIVHKTNVGEVTLVEEYFPNGTEKLWVNRFRNRKQLLPKVPAELIPVAKECDERNLYKFNYLREGNITFYLANNRKVLVRETKMEDGSLSIDLFYLADLLA
jgi:hypothetical protein